MASGPRMVDVECQLGRGRESTSKHTTTPATGARSATDVKQRRWAAGGKCPRSGRLSLSRSTPYQAATGSGQSAEARRATQVPLKRAAVLDASISPEQREKARRNRQEAVARRAQMLAAADDEWLREADWSLFDPGMEWRGGAGGGCWR